MKDILKSAMYLFLRVVLVSILAAMALAACEFAPTVLTPIFALFYFIMLIYFFVFTMWSVGGKDRIKVDRGVMKKNMAKGFVSSGILAVFLLFIYFASFLFGQFMDELVLRVWGFIKLFFTMFPMYMTIWLTSLEVSADIQTLVAAIVYVVTLISCVVGAGIGYIVGFKRIPIIQPWLDKWKRN